MKICTTSNPRLTKARGFRLCLSLAVLTITLGWGTAASAQPLIGSLDWVDQDSALGWACHQGVPGTTISVNLWARNTATYQWTYIGTEIADKGRDDVGGAGVCGTTPDSYFHGFEKTIYPESLINSQGTYEIFAYVGSTPLPGSGTVSFATGGFPTTSNWRTDYDDPNARLVAMVSCIWPFKGANPLNHGGSWGAPADDDDPLFLNAGATIKQSSWESAPGVFSGPSWCLRNDAANPASWYWSQSNSATNAWQWPMTNYWVVSVNNELAYSKVQSGPPSQSQPVNGGMFSVGAGKSTFNLGITNNTSNGYSPTDHPFLSIGAQMGRGSAGPIGWIQPSGQDTHVEFQVRQLAESPGDYHDIAVYVEMMWGGYKRWIGVSLVQATQHRFHWNWNALESFWFPGGEFNLLGTSTLAQRCPLIAAQLPQLGSTTIGQTRQVSLPLRGILQCLETQYLPNGHPGVGGTLGWQVARPSGLPLAITGVHLAIEHAPGQSGAYMQTEFTKPTLVNH